MSARVIKLAEESLVASVKESEGKVIPYTPAGEIENSLIGLLKHQIEKLKESEVYINAFQEAILARLPEATFQELVDALSRAQSSKNSLMEKILSPVIPKAGSTAPLLDATKDEKKVSEDEMFVSANKETLQALTELTKLVKEIKKEDTSTKVDDIKKSIGLS